MDRGQINSRTLLLLSVVITIVLWQLPMGRLALYPFTLLATYAHEMGHGLTAMLLGGKFLSLEMSANGSGVARNAVGSGLARALVAAGGLVGPSVAGAALLVAGRRAALAKPLLLALGLAMGLSALIWARGPFAPAFIATVAVTLVMVSRVASQQVALLTLQFIAVQLCLSVFKDIDYMFRDQAVVGDRLMMSDSAAIAEVLLLPYWFWGGVTAIFCFAVLALGLRSALRTRPVPSSTRRR